ncbi:hypothetical protein PAECIP111893_02390 [Paenibacillus plantiphilus]|uniref:Uncharacterized protein n=1 Tax=Paenibacillus plantiphilus TaxID=2905650 RepID=A0ABM9C846_9BACL|nr:hypothetical protein [Paenibacillus plantiphilus]CAH1205671.1 hypothetical protein PAECIP111893_02390 [Paenibacillus plantiphilus]
MTTDMVVMLGIAGVLVIVVLACLVTIYRNLHRLIERQQDTIQRLINHEPVTYTETGQKPPKPVRESFAAWGNEVVNVEELE